QICPDTGDAQRTVGLDLMTNRMLHEGVCYENEVAGNPAPKRNCHRRHEMISGSQSLLAPNERADERALKKEREHAFHRQGLTDNAAGIAGEVRPVRSELKFHWNAGDDPDGKIESENLGPKPGCLIVLFITRPQRAPFPIHEEPPESHR